MTFSSGAVEAVSPRQVQSSAPNRLDSQNSEQESVLVIVPAFREEASVAEVVRQIRALPRNVTGRFTLDVLVVDDGSPDRTAERARAAGAVVACLPVNLGVGVALQTGFRYAVSRGYTTVVTVDADGQHPVSHIPTLLGVVRDKGVGGLKGVGGVQGVGSPEGVGGLEDVRGLEGFKGVEITEGVESLESKALVVGSRFVPGSVAPEWVSSTRSLAMGVLRRRLTRRTGVHLYDPTSGFRVIRDPLLSRFALDFPATYLGDTFEAHLSAAAILGAGQIAEVSVPMKPRVTGVPSSAGIRNVAYFARALLTTARLIWHPLGTSQPIDTSHPLGTSRPLDTLRFEDSKGSRA